MATLTERFDLAVRYYQSGNLPQAEELCRQVVEAEPKHAAAHHLLGILALQAGRRDEASRLIRQAIALNPANDECYFNLAIVLTNQGQQPTEAIACYRQAVRLNPRHAMAHNNLANILRDQGQVAEALLCYREALRINPHLAVVSYNLGNALKDQDQEAEAALCYRQALAANPNYADAHNNLGVIHMKQGQVAEAAECFQQALRINPLLTDAHFNLGNALNERGQLTQAVHYYRQALGINPRHAEAHQHLSIALMHLGLVPEALEHNEQSLRINPSSAPAIVHRGVLRLLMGDYERGWNDWEQRWALPNTLSRSFRQPRWDGSSLEGKAILVHAEGGYGDTFQLVRYLPLVKKRGGTVLFLCQPALVPLCSSLRGIDQVIANGAPVPVEFGYHISSGGGSEPRPPCDVEVSLLSLPGIFGTTLASIPAAIPYLHADAGLVASWRKKLEPSGGFKVGINWQGNRFSKGDRYRSVALTHFEPLARVEGVRLFSLQVGQAADQLATTSFPVTDVGSQLDPNSLGDLAAVMMNLDLIITVETGVAHLAGALGVPVWVVLSTGSAWMWLRERADSPWYPTMRLFRQRQFGNWSGVFQRVADELRLLSAHQFGNHEAAGELPRRAGALNPADPGSHFHLGLVLTRQGRVSEAADCFRQAVRLNPRFVDALNNLGLLLKELGELGQALESFRQALSIQPGHAAVAYNLGNILMEQGELAEAARCFRTALNSDPQYVGAYNNLGCVLMDLGQREEAAACFDEALRLKPEHAPTLWNRARLRLLQGDFPKAWTDYECRWQEPGFAQSHQDRPRWDGSPLGGRTVLLYPEQGLGDTIQFIRYAALVKQQGGRVVFECPPALSRLLTGVSGIDQFVRAGTALPPFDVQAPLLSLPDIFGTTLATIPAAVPYLRADPGLVARWKEELRPLGGFKIGVAWQGNSQHAGDRYRSFPLKHFESLARLEGVRLVSLQKGQGIEQLQERFPILDLGDRLDAEGAFLDTAAVMMNLDLVIAVDSAVAHLAGALAVPVWVALAIAPDWRWLLERADSPWYPTMRLFRQERFADWTEVFERIATALKTRVSE